ncbi:MAG: hypothetical protein P8M67_00880, partial [Opitutales bacterium]|nr:hypothetical protein [Opitutales bacterium]
LSNKYGWQIPTFSVSMSLLLFKDRFWKKGKTIKNKRSKPKYKSGQIERSMNPFAFRRLIKMWWM